MREERDLPSALKGSSLTQAGFPVQTQSQGWGGHLGPCSKLLGSLCPVSHLPCDLGFSVLSRTDPRTPLEGGKGVGLHNEFQTHVTPAALSGSLPRKSSSWFQWAIGGTKVSWHCFWVISQILGEMAYTHPVITNLISIFPMVGTGCNSS